MKSRYLNRQKLTFYPLKERENRSFIERDKILPGSPPEHLSDTARERIIRAAESIRQAREKGAPAVLAFGAHTIKNGMGPLLISLLEEGWITHLATNGAGIIHDWEFAFQGATSEHVKENVRTGKFGMWQETGLYINTALAVGAYRGLGYGESIGSMVFHDGLQIPPAEELRQAAASADSPADRRAAAADLLGLTERLRLPAGFLQIPHPFKQYGVQASAYRLGVPFTGHPMFGHDIIYTHPANCGAAVGRTAERDFLSFAESISRIDNGVYLSVGSAVMSPMIFEKSMSMAKNLALQKGREPEGYSIYVVDLAESAWDWDSGEPPENDPAYYLRFCKSFSRMGGSMQYITADNRDFLTELYNRLRKGA